MFFEFEFDNYSDKPIEYNYRGDKCMVLYVNSKMMITPALWRYCTCSDGKHMVISDIGNLSRLSLREDKGYVGALHTEEADYTDGCFYAFLVAGGKIQRCNVVLSEEEEIQANIVFMNKKYNFPNNT